MSEATSDLTALGNEARTLLEALKQDANDDGRVQLSLAALTKRSGLTQGALVRARSELTRNLLIKVEKGYSNNGRRGANVYVLSKSLFEPVSLAPMEGESGQSRAEELTVVPAPAVSLAPAPSKDPEATRSSIWSRMFRRKHAS